MRPVTAHPDQYILAKWEGLLKTGFQDTEALEHLGLDPRDFDGVSKLQETVDKIRTLELRPFYDYASQMFIYKDEAGKPIAYAKPGVMRSQHEPLLRRVARSFGFEDSVAPTAPWVIHPKEMDLFQVAQLRNVIELGGRQQSVPRAEACLYTEPLLIGKEAVHIVGRDGDPSQVAKGSSCPYVAPFVGVLSPAVEFQTKGTSHLEFMKFTLLNCILGGRDINDDAFGVDLQGCYTVIDGEEYFACNSKMSKPTLDIAYLASASNLAGQNISDKDLDALLSLVDSWDYSRAIQQAEGAQILFRDKALESKKVQSESSKPRLRKVGDNGHQVVIYPTSREKQYFPPRTFEDEKLLHPDQVQGLIVRAKKVSLALRKTRLARELGSRWGTPLEETTLNAWTLAFVTDNNLLRRCAAASEARERLLSQSGNASKALEMRRKFHHLRLDSNSSFISCATTHASDPKASFPKSCHSSYRAHAFAASWGVLGTEVPTAGPAPRGMSSGLDTEDVFI